MCPVAVAVCNYCQRQLSSRNGKGGTAREAKMPSVVLNRSEEGRKPARRDGGVQAKKLSCCVPEGKIISASVTEDNSVERARGTLTALGWDFYKWI